jgi:hypothetical protein
VKFSVRKTYHLIRFLLKTNQQQVVPGEKEMNVLIAESVQVVGMTVEAKEVDVNVAEKAVVIVVTRQVEINHADSHIS